MERTDSTFLIGSFVRNGKAPSICKMCVRIKDGIVMRRMIFMFNWPMPKISYVRQFLQYTTCIRNIYIYISKLYVNFANKYVSIKLIWNTIFVWSLSGSNSWNIIHSLTHHIRMMLKAIVAICFRKKNHSHTKGEFKMSVFTGIKTTTNVNRRLSKVDVCTVFAHYVLYLILLHISGEYF